MYRLVRQMNLPSDNYYAEVLNKDIAVARGLHGHDRQRPLRHPPLPAVAAA